MRDVRKRTAMHEHRVILERLYQIGFDRVLQHRRHGALRLQIARTYGRACARRPDNDVGEPPLEIRNGRRQTEDRHHFGGDGNVETVLARETIRRPAQR